MQRDGGEQEVRPDGLCTSEVDDLRARPMHELGREAAPACLAASVPIPDETKVSFSQSFFPSDPGLYPD